VWIQTAFDGPKSHDYIASNPRAACGGTLSVEPCLDPDERSVNEKGVMVETSTHSINIRHGGSSRGDNTIIPRYPNGRFLCRPMLI
jgi:hypothetical protein